MSYYRARSFTTLFVQIGQALETDVPFAVGRSKVRTIGQAVETDIAQTMGVLQGNWQPITLAAFIQGGGAQSRSFAAQAPAGHDYFLLAPGSPALPAGVTLNVANKSFDYDGTTAVAPTSVVLRSFSLAAEWAQQSQGAGVRYRHNFTYKNAAETQLITNTADLLASRAGFASGTDSALQWDQAIKLSGAGACRMNMAAANPGVYSGCALDFAGIGLATKAVQLTHFWIRIGVYYHNVYRNFFYGDSNNWGGKNFIIACWNKSAQPGEIVVRRLPMPGGYLHGYRYTGGNAPVFWGSATNLFELEWGALNDWTFNNFYDKGSGAITTQQLLRRRYGPDYQQWNNTTPDADVVLSGAPTMPADGWGTIEVEVDQVNDKINVWFARLGEPPQLIMGSVNAYLPPVGTSDQANINPQPLYTGVQLTNYPNTAQFWPAADTFVSYGEVIVSTQPIPFHGGYSLPSLYSGYPPAGAIER